MGLKLKWDSTCFASRNLKVRVLPGPPNAHVAQIVEPRFVAETIGVQFLTWAYFIIGG